MNEREVLELMRDVLFGSVSMGRQDLLYEIHHRLAALTEAAQETPDPTRCYVCGWPLAESRKQGCVAGDCSYRPTPGTPEHDRIKDRLRAQMSAPAAAQADGEEPTVEVITSLIHGNEVSANEAWAQCPECRPRAEKILALCRARPAPSHALVEAADAMRGAIGDPLFVTRPLRDAAWRYDIARSSLPAAKKEGGA